MMQFQIVLLGLFVPFECTRGTSFWGVGRGGLEAGRNKFLMVTTNDRSPIAENLEDEKYFLTFINPVNILMYFPPVFFFSL